MAEAHWSHNARFRQGDDRRRLLPDDDLFPPRGAWREADRADGIGIESLARSFHRGLARSRAGCKARGSRPLCGRASICAPPPPRRDPRGKKPHSEMDDAGYSRWEHSHKDLLISLLPFAQEPVIEPESSFRSARSP